MVWFGGLSPWKIGRPGQSARASARPDRPKATPVHAVTEPVRWGYRGDFPESLCGATALLIQTVPQTEPPQTHFLKVGKTQILQRQSGGVTLRSYAATPVSGWRGDACAQTQP